MLRLFDRHLSVVGCDWSSQCHREVWKKVQMHQVADWHEYPFDRKQNMAKLMDPICGAPGGQRAHVLCRALESFRIVQKVWFQVGIRILTVAACLARAACV